MKYENRFYRVTGGLYRTIKSGVIVILAVNQVFVANHQSPCTPFVKFVFTLLLCVDVINQGESGPWINLVIS